MASNLPSNIGLGSPFVYGSDALNLHSSGCDIPFQSAAINNIFDVSQHCALAQSVDQTLRVNHNQNTLMQDLSVKQANYWPNWATHTYCNAEPINPGNFPSIHPSYFTPVSCHDVPWASDQIQSFNLESLNSKQPLNANNAYYHTLEPLESRKSLGDCGQNYSELQTATNYYSNLAHYQESQNISSDAGNAYESKGIFDSHFLSPQYQNHTGIDGVDDEIVKFASLPRESTPSYKMPNFSPITQACYEQAVVPVSCDGRNTSNSTGFENIGYSGGVRNDEVNNRSNYSSKRESVLPAVAVGTCSINVTATGPDGNRGTFKLVAATPQNGGEARSRRPRRGRGSLLGQCPQFTEDNDDDNSNNEKCHATKTTTTRNLRSGIVPKTSRRHSDFLTKHTVKYLVQVVKNQQNHHQIFVNAEQRNKESVTGSDNDCGTTTDLRLSETQCRSILNYTDPNLERSFSETRTPSMVASQAETEPDDNNQSAASASCMRANTGAALNAPVSMFAKNTTNMVEQLGPFSWNCETTMTGRETIENNHLDTTCNTTNLANQSLPWMSSQNSFLDKSLVVETPNKRRNRCYDFETLRVGYFRVPDNAGRNKLRFYFTNGFLVYDFDYSYVFSGGQSSTSSSSSMSVPLVVAVIIPVNSIVGVEFRSKKIAIYVSKTPRLVSGFDRDQLQDRQQIFDHLNQYNVDVTDGQLSSPFHFITLPRAQGLLIQKHFLAAYSEFARRGIDTLAYPYVADFLQDDLAPPSIVGVLLNRSVVLQSTRFENPDRLTKEQRKPTSATENDDDAFCNRICNGMAYSTPNASHVSGIDPSQSHVATQHRYAYNTRSHSSQASSTTKNSNCTSRDLSNVGSLDELDAALRSIAS